MDQKPSIGRIVHYTPRDNDLAARKGQPYAAVITHVWGETCVNLHVVDDGSFPLPCELRPTSVQIGQGPGTWCWPPRV